MHLERLIEQVSHRVPAPDDGLERVAEPMDGLLLLRRESPSALEASLYEPVLCLILQGRKQVSFGDRTLSFGPGECLLVSSDLPVSSAVTGAPYLAVVLRLDLVALRQLRDEVEEATLDGQQARAAVTHRADPGLLDALSRYVALADSPAHARILGPLVRKELHYRLLVAPFGGMLRSLIRRDSTAAAVARAIGQLRADLDAPMAIPELARRVGMSASSFHKHFKAITATTPLQYQKELRLLEARRLLRAGGASVTAAAYEVGYESSSQFSREYARKFGIPPSRDLATAPGQDVSSAAPPPGASRPPARRRRSRWPPGASAST